MADKCYAPVFQANNFLVCFILNVIYAWVIFMLFITLAFLSARGRCLIKQYQYRMKRCGEGNGNPDLPI